MNRTYSNLPFAKSDDSSANTVKYFNQYYEIPLDIDNNVTLSIKAFFEKRGFSPDSSEAIALIIVSQATKENFNPTIVLDSMGKLDSPTLSSVVAEILNYNRFKTSTLGTYVNPVAADEIQRNIIA
jgi:hypothetical protein